MATPTPTPPLTPIPEGLESALDDLHRLTHELLNHGCLDFHDEVGHDKFDEIGDDLWYKDEGTEDEDTPCSEKDPRFPSPNIRKACLECFAYNEYGVRITTENEVYAGDVRQLIRALINITNSLKVRIQQSCSDLDLPDDLLSSVFASEININLLPGEGWATSTTDPENDSVQIDLPIGTLKALTGNDFINPEWLILHELSHGFHNRLGFCTDEDPCTPIIHTEGVESITMSPLGVIPIVVWQFLQETGGYWNLSGNRDYGDEWSPVRVFTATDRGAIALTSLNDVNGNPISAWYNNSRLNGGQNCDHIQKRGTDEEFVYVDRNGDCVSPENAVYYRDVDAYIPFFPKVTIPNRELRLKMPNATGATLHASPSEDFADSLAHFINTGPSDMRNSDKLGLGDDPRVQFIEDNFCTWIGKLISSNE